MKRLAMHEMPGNHVRSLLAWLLHVDTTDPVRRVLNRGMAVSSLLLLVLACLFVPLVFVGDTPATAKIGSLIGAGMMLLVWWINRQGSRWGAVILGLALMGVNAVSYTPATYVAVEGNPISHSGFLFPVILVTCFANPWWGFLIVLVQNGALGWVALSQGYEQQAVLTFFMTSSANMLASYIVIAIAAAIFRHSVHTSAELTESLEQKVEQRTRALNVANHARIETMLTVAHDTRNLLTMRDGDIWALRLAVQESDQAMIAEILESFEFSSRLLTGGMTDLKESAMAASGQFELAFAKADFIAVTKGVLAEFSAAFERDNLELTLNAPAAPIWIDMDAARLVRVFHNILGNALKHTRGQGTGVNIQIEATDTDVRWRCYDDGAGMEPATIARLGELFFCAKRGENAPEGTGIGLYFSIQIVERHGGSIQFASEGPTRGSVVTVSLPLHRGTV